MFDFNAMNNNGMEKEELRELCEDSYFPEYEVDTPLGVFYDDMTEGIDDLPLTMQTK